MYNKSVSVKASQDAEHLRLFFYNEGVIGPARGLLEHSLRQYKLPAIPYCKHSFEQVETQEAFVSLTKLKSQ